tara:strand:- start:2874 stop:3197 length:324 start_codon:yes stop_codon:yes gene_type:complete
MSEDIDEIRRKKALELMQSMEGKTEEEHQLDIEEMRDLLPWSFRTNVTTGFTEILHHPQMRQSADDPNVVAIAVDVQFADMVTDMLNRAFLWKEASEEAATQEQEAN